MTLVTIDLGDVAGGHDPDDHVIIRAEAFRESQGGGVTSTAEVKIPLVDGVGQAEVEPGPVVVSFRCRAVADTREKRGVVPDTGPVGIERVLENAFEYLPPVVNRALETIKDAVAAEVDAIKWDRGHVPLDATSISDLDVGSWNVSNDTRAGIVGTPGLRLGNLSIGSIGTSKTATFISQGTASEKPGMWVQAERLGVWSGWQQVLPAVVPPSDLWYRGYVDESHVTLNDLANGAWGVSGRDHAVRFGLPADFGSLQLMQIGSSRSAFFIGQETGMWIATSQGQVWGEWKRPGATLDELNNVGAGLKTVPVAVSTGAGGAGELAGRYRVLTQVTAPVTRFRVHFSTAHPMWEGERGPSTLGTVYIGHRSGDAGITNQFTLRTGNSTVAAAGEWVSQWITHDLSRETLIDFQVTATNAYNLIAPAWKQDGASWVQQTTVPLWVWLEVETYAETPTVALVGDSTGAGSGSHMPVWDSALHIHARREGFIPVLYASSGDLLEGNTDPEDRNYKRWAGFGPYDSVIIQAGSNDLHNGTTLSAMQEHYIAVTEAVAQLSSVVLAGTVKPRYPAHPEYDGTRVAYNTWLKTQPGTTRAVVDFSAAVAPSGSIDPADNADGAHLTSSGHQKMATAFAGVTVARDPLASKAMIEAADEALGQRIDNEKWWRGNVPSTVTSLDELGVGGWGIGSAGMATNLGLPSARMGVLDIKKVGGATTVSFTTITAGSSPGETWQATTNSIGAWSAWEKISGIAAQFTSVRTDFAAADTALGQLIDGKAEKSYVDAADTALGQRITDEKWWRGNVPGTATSLADLGIGGWGVASASMATKLGLPAARIGTLDIKRVSGATVAEFTTTRAGGAPGDKWVATSDTVGVWGPWTTLTWVTNTVLDGNTPVENLASGLYPVESGTVATALGLPSVGAGSVWVHRINPNVGRIEWRPAGSTDVWGKSREGSTWGAWKLGGGTGELPEHTHDDRYYTKSQVDALVPDGQSAGEITGVNVDLVDTGINMVPTSIGVDGMMYGHHRAMAHLLRSDDGLATEPPLGPRILDFVPPGSGVVHVERTTAGYLFIHKIDMNNHQVWFSEEWMGPYEKVLDMGPWVDTAWVKPQLVGGVTWLMIAEYTNAQYPSWPLRRWLSTDGGMTWELVAETKMVTDQVNSHHHTGLILPNGRIYSSEGDGPNQWFGYSDDLGKTWVPVEIPEKIRGTHHLLYSQPTMMIDFGDTIFTSPDSGPYQPSMWRMNPHSHDQEIVWELGPGGPYTDASKQYGRMRYAQPGYQGKQAYVMFADGGSGNPDTYIVATPDGGDRWGIVATIDSGTGKLEAGVIGPDRHGYCYMRGANIPSYGYNVIRFRSLDWTQIDY